jgi:predicted nucleic acid-binding protein
MKIVFNTSPLIFLTRLNLLQTFLEEPAEFYSPPAVQTEILVKQDEVSQSIQPLFEQEIALTPIPNPELADRINQQLGRGESEAIALAIALQANYTILDDFAARRAAQRLGLTVKGTLAILNKLNQEGKFPIEDPDKLYQQLQEIRFRVKRSVFDSIFPRAD